MKDRHLIISLTTNSWGSTAMARTIADELAAAGDDVLFVVRESGTPVMAAAKFRHHVLPEHMLPLTGLVLKDLVAQQSPKTVILSDYFGNANFLTRMGIESDCMLPANRPVFAIDPWNCDRIGYEVDTTTGRSIQVGPQSTEAAGSPWLREFESIPYKLNPVPIVPPAGSKGCFRALPVGSPSRRNDRLLSRQKLGLTEHDRLVLFCTNQWQHPRPGSPLKRQSEALPKLLAEYVSRLGSSVHLLHVGPEPYVLEAKMNGRYHWLPPLAPPEFDCLIAGVDLMVSANISATTIAKAMMFSVPVVVLHNSVKAVDREEAEKAMQDLPSPWMSAWLEEAIPLLPFVLWPIGFHRFLAPLLKDNPYIAALEMVEILDERRMHAVLAAMLFDQGRREEQIHRQAIYLNMIASLPTGAQAIKEMC